MASVSIDEKYSTAGYFGSLPKEVDLSGIPTDEPLVEIEAESLEKVQALSSLQDKCDAASSPQDVPYGYW
jgi:hypothetical protein